MLNQLEKRLYQDDIIYTEALLGKALRSVSNFRKKELAPHHLSHREAHTLFILFNLGHKATLAEIAEYRERRGNTISVQMNKMKKDGLVTAARDVPNSNMLSYELTEKGLNVLNKITKIANPQIISMLSDDERRQFIALLEKITNMSRK
jgi:DNA-binding MarR family transcriptional regulator